MWQRLFIVLLLTACTGPDGIPVPDREGAVKTVAVERAERRAYDGAPPVIPHENFDIVCGECHDAEGMAVEDVGFAPPSPHGKTAGLSDISRCRQCHVFQKVSEPWKGNSFAGLSQDLRRGERLNPLAPPVIPHKVFMRENCLACHSGPAAREAIRTSHPERARCRQCHLAQVTTESFVPLDVSPGVAGLASAPDF